MTNLEASNLLGHLIGTLDINCKHDYELITALVMGMDALEKQIPKKLVEKKTLNGYKAWVCPSCGHSAYGGLHCRHCGQAIDWEKGEMNK